MTPTDIYKKLIMEKCPPANERERVYGSIILAMAERVEKLERQSTEMIKAIRFIASKSRNDVVDESVEEQPTEGGTEAETEGPARQQDQTPFPAGVSAAAPAGAASASTATGPIVEEVSEIPTPDVSSGPGVNAAPIPKKPKNGAGKDAVA